MCVWEILCRKTHVAEELDAVFDTETSGLRLKRHKTRTGSCYAKTEKREIAFDRRKRLKQEIEAFFRYQTADCQKIGVWRLAILRGV